MRLRSYVLGRPSMRTHINRWMTTATIHDKLGLVSPLLRHRHLSQHRIRSSRMREIRTPGSNGREVAVRPPSTHFLSPDPPGGIRDRGVFVDRRPFDPGRCEVKEGMQAPVA